MNVKPTVIRLPAGMPERIDAIAGPNKRAEFIREAVEKELSRREKKR
jgi:predicted DNA-binding protein